MIDCFSRSQMQALSHRSIKTSKNKLLHLAPKITSQIWRTQKGRGERLCTATGSVWEWRDLVPCSATGLWLGEQPTKGKHSAVSVCSGPKHRRPTKRIGGRERRQRKRSAWRRAQLVASPLGFEKKAATWGIAGGGAGFAPHGRPRPEIRETNRRLRIATDYEQK